jgi:hypothetical protein
MAWQWPGGKRIAVVFNVCLEAWSDGKAPGIGPMGNPLPAGALDTMAISWAAYGVKRGIYRLLDALVEENKANIARCTSLLRDASGRPVEGWLSPRGTSGPELPLLLAEAGYKWYGDVFDDDLPYVQRFGNLQIVAIPLATDVNDMPFMKYGNPPKLMLESFEENLAVARREENPAMIDVTVHAHIFGHPRGARIFEQIVARAVDDPDVWVATRLGIAQFMLKQNA